MALLARWPCGASVCTPLDHALRGISNLLPQPALYQRSDQEGASHCGRGITTVPEGHEGFIVNMRGLGNLVAALASLASQPALAQTQSLAQQRCINTLNRGTAKVALTQAKNNATCINRATKSKLKALTTTECIFHDVKGTRRLSKAMRKSARDSWKRCVAPEQPPDFGYTNAQFASLAAASHEAELVVDIFGVNLAAAIITVDLDPTLASCQASIVNAYEKLAAAKIKQFNTCAKVGLRDGSVTSEGSLKECITGASNSIDTDPKGTIGRAKDRLDGALSRRCAGTDLGMAFPGRCFGAANLTNCLNERIDCRVCLMLDAANNMSADCDLFDDNLGNGSCTSGADAVTFPDPDLEAAIRDAIGKPGGTISSLDLLFLRTLYLYGNGIDDLSGIEYCNHLTTLSLDNSQVSDFSLLAALTNLRELYLRYNQLSDIGMLATLTNLYGLVLDGNQVSDLSPLTTLTKLEYLSLDNNQLSDISPLATLTNLYSLTLDGTQISDINPLAALSSLRRLSLKDTQLSDISPLAALTKLYSLTLSNNLISDLSPLAALRNLRHLSLGNSQISNIDSLATLSELYSLTLSNNLISGINPLAALTKLHSLTLDNNLISNISPLAALTKLHSLTLDNNLISNISPLAALTKLHSLALSNNQISNVGPLVDNPGLGSWDRVYLLGNPLSNHSLNIDIPALVSRGVTVDY